MRSFRTRLVAAPVVMLLVASCGLSSSTSQTPPPTGGTYGAGIDLSDVDKTPVPAARSVAQGGRAAPVGSERQDGGATRASSAPAASRVDLSKKPTMAGSAGNNVYWYLNKTRPKLVIETDVVGSSPFDGTLDHLVAKLREVADKPGGIRVLPVQRLPAGRTTWQPNDLATFESRYRETAHTADTMSIYILFVSGDPRYGGGGGTLLGHAYTASAVVLYSDNIRGDLPPLLGADDLERAVLVHEVGHLLALVNQTYKSPRDHEDPEHPGHSGNEDSIMYWALEFGDAVAALAGNLPTDFDADDLADLRDLKTGKLP